METQKKTSTRKVLTVVSDYLIITLGLLCYTAGWCIFVIPNGIVGGGVSGIGAIVQYATNGAIPVSYTFFFVNLILLIIGVKTLGKAFGVKTVYAVVVASLLFRVLPEVIPQTFIEELALANGKLLCALIGGAMSGLGIGMAFSRGGSTAGTDVIALIISKYRNIPPGRIILLCDIRRHFRNVDRLLYMQLSFTSVFLFAVIIVYTVRNIRRLLCFIDQRAAADRMQCSGRNIEKVPLFDFESI